MESLHTEFLAKAGRLYTEGFTSPLLEKPYFESHLPRKIDAARQRSRTAGSLRDCILRNIDYSRFEMHDSVNRVSLRQQQRQNANLHTA